MTEPASAAGESSTFPREARLTRATDFKRVLNAPCRVSSGSLTFVALPSLLGRPRLGLAIPKRHLARAVARNRVKRLVRESFRHHRLSLPSLDIVVLGRPGLAKLSTAELRAAIERAWPELIRRCGTP